MLKNLDDLGKRLRFESKIEDRRSTTASWYIKQIATIPVAEMLKVQLNELLAIGNVFYAESAERLVASQQFSAAVLTIHSGLEYLHKFDHNLGRASILMRIVESHRISKDIALENVDFAHIRTEMSLMQKRLIQNLSKCIPHLIENETFESRDTPDMLGYALTMIGEEYFRALHDNEGQLAAEMFPRYLGGVIKKWESLVRQPSEGGYSNFAMPADEALLEVFALSGMPSYIASITIMQSFGSHARAFGTIFFVRTNGRCSSLYLRIL